MCPYFREKLTENFVVTEIITTFAIGSEEKYRAIMHRYYFAHSQESLGNLDWYNKHRNNCDRVACWEGFCVPLRIE